MRLDRERGVTRVSLENGTLLTEERGRPVRLELRAPAQYDHQVVAAYGDGSRHVFTGFSWGYGGEGPSGLARFCAANGILLTKEQIVAFNFDATGDIWSWPRP
jgi:hypothetical protein